MRSRSVIVFSLLVLINSLFGVHITGKIISEKNKPIQDVIVNHNGRISLSNKNGIYTIENPNYQKKILFHKIGYTDIEVEFSKLKTTTIMNFEAIELEGLSTIGKQWQPTISPDTGKKTIKINKNSTKYISLPQILKNEANINIKGISLPGSKQTISITGNETKHSVIMLDGIKLNSQGEAFDLSTIPVEIIDKIEILDGSGSAIAGSGSVGGIINIVTKSHNDCENLQQDRINLSSYFGSYNYQKNVLGFFKKNNLFNINLTLSKENSLNDFLFKTIQGDFQKRKNNSYDTKDLTLITSISFKNIFITHKSLYTNFNRGLPGPINLIQMYDQAKLYGTLLKNTLQIHYETSKNINVISNLYSFYNRIKYSNLRSTNQIYKSESINKTIRKGVDLKINKRNDLCFYEIGIEKLIETFFYSNILAPKNSISEKESKNLALFANGTYLFQNDLFNTEFETNLRYDKINLPKIENDNEYYNYRVGLNLKYESRYNLILGGNFGSGFSSPSFYDLFWIGDNQTSGNPDLKPELSKGGKIYGKINTDKSKLKFEKTLNKIENKIFWYKSVNNLWKPGNIRDSKIETYQLNFLSNFIENWEIEFFWMRTFAFDISSEKKQFVPHIPTSKTIVSVKYMLKNASAKISYTRFGKQRDKLDDHPRIIKDYELVDFTTNYSLIFKKYQFLLFLNLNNILNVRYEKIEQTPNSTFNWNSGISIKISI